MYRTSWIVIFLGSVMSAGGSDHLTSDSSIRVRIVEGGESIAQAVECRRMLVGPGVNQPDLFPGYEGFVGWKSPLRLRNATMLLGFPAGYWHASPPKPLRVPPKKIKIW